MIQLRLDALFGCKDSEYRRQHDCVEVFDFFCGAGGFSCGAESAGCKVVFACDNNEDALETHRRNHPRAQHVCADLPIENIPFPTDGRPFHVHGSPPCQKLSKCNHGTATSEDVSGSLNLIDWFVEMAINSGATSWSMEEVASKHAITLMEAIRQKHRSSVAYGVFYFDELGVPQTRKRLLAGSPHLISKLQRLRCATKRRTIGDVVERPRGTHLRGTVSSKGQRKKARAQAGEARYVYKKAELGEFCRAIDQPSLTIPTHGMAWITKELGGKAHTRLELYPHEAAAIQTFPRTYKWPDKKVIAMRQVGNAVPPLVAELLMRPESVRPERCGSPSLTLHPE